MGIPSAELAGSTMERSIAWNSSRKAREAGRAVATGTLVPGAPGFRPGLLTLARQASYKAISHKSLEKSLEVEMTSLNETLAQLNAIYDGLIAMKKLAETAHKNDNTLTADDLDGINDAYIALRSSVRAISNEYRAVADTSTNTAKILPSACYTVFLNDTDENVRIVISTSSAGSITGVSTTLSSALNNVSTAGNALDQLASAVQLVLDDITKYEAAIEVMDSVREMSSELRSSFSDTEADRLEIDVPELMQTVADGNLAVQKALKIAGEHVTLDNLNYTGIANIF